MLLVMTAVTGIVDAVSYLALGHVFTANMTGNVVLLGLAVARAGGLSAARSLAALACFIAGAILGGRLALHKAQRALLCESGLLLGASLVALLPRRDPAIYAVIALTAFAMGYRNAVVRKIAVPDLTTTVLTLTITALGADSALAGGDNPRWRRRIAAVLALITGAWVGALLENRSTSLALLVCALTTGSCGIVAFRLARKDTQRQ
jgi:uncharacterized membrane protein YoaK (UPF0700 family)